MERYPTCTIKKEIEKFDRIWDLPVPALHITQDGVFFQGTPIGAEVAGGRKGSSPAPAITDPSCLP